MNHAQHNQITAFLWNIADDVLRDLYVRGKYRDVILPMTVLRRLDALLVDSKSAVLEEKIRLDAAGIINQDMALRMAAGTNFYNTSPFVLADLQRRGTAQSLEADFNFYLDSFSPNVTEILDCFEFRNQIPRLSRADALGQLLNKFLDPAINLSPHATNGLPGLDNHAMGTIFEELVRRFNEENNEEAGEHWTPRDAVKLMANLIFLPVADQIQSGSYLLYDGACGTGGMLTVAEETLCELAQERGKDVVTHLFGQEINAETYAICKADLLLKGEGEAADNIVGGPQFSTLANDAFRAREFDFMLSNPPYGKSWKSDLERMGGKDGLTDPRFVIEHDGDPEFSLVTRTSDGQLLFLANLLAKMKPDTPLGSRIAEVHNGSSLFTGDAGQGESNIRRWVIESDWLEAIVALPLNLFYNTGIATYIWVLSNRKPAHRRGKVQLIDATNWFAPLRKNLGKKNCELAPEDIARISQSFLDFEESPQSKIFDNAAFGYQKIRVERPLRLKSQANSVLIHGLRFASGDATLRVELYDAFGERLWDDYGGIERELKKFIDDWDDVAAVEGDDAATAGARVSEKIKKRLLDRKSWARDASLCEAAELLRRELGEDEWDDYNEFRARAEAVWTRHKNRVKLSAAEKKLVLRSLSWRDENAAPVVAKTHKAGKQTPDRLHGLFEEGASYSPHCHSERSATQSRAVEESTLAANVSASVDSSTSFVPHSAQNDNAGKVGRSIEIVEYESDPELRDYEQVPLLEEGGIAAFVAREVWPYTPDAWVDEAATKIGYEISFTRHFYAPQPLRALSEIRADIAALERETEGLLGEILVETEDAPCA